MPRILCEGSRGNRDGTRSSDRRDARTHVRPEDGDDSDEGNDMCRWLAYSGSPVLLDELLYKTEHSLIVQSLHSRLGAEETNGDGFGIGWYGSDDDEPALFRGIEPAWNDRHLRDLSKHI